MNVFTDRVAQSSIAATEFLLATRRPDLLWRDFHTLAGQSSDWVTGFTLVMLSELEGPVRSETQRTARMEHLE